MNIHQYVTITEQAIAAAFVNNGLAVHLCGGIQAPHTLTYSLKLYDPTVSNINKALRLSAVVEALINDSPVHIYTDRGLIYVEIPSPWPVTINGAALKGKALNVPIGMSSRRRVVGFDFEVSPHLLLVGPTKRGKTTAARLVAHHLARQNLPGDVQFIVSTFKPKDWKAFGNLSHTLAVIVEPTESAQMLEWLVRLMHERTKNQQETPKLFVFLDDLLNLLAVVDVTELLSQLASLGRGAGIHLIVGTQRLGKRGAGDAAVSGNIPDRVVFGTADAQDAAFFTGRSDSGAERLGRYKGDALFVMNGGVQRVAVAYITDESLTSLPQNPYDWRPWNITVSDSPTPLDDDTGAPVQEWGVAADMSPDSTDSPTGAPVEFPLPRRTPTTAEKEALRQLYKQLGSKNQVLFKAYGVKSSQTLGWLNEALDHKSPG